MATELESPFKTLLYVSSPLHTAVPINHLQDVVPSGKQLQFKTTDKCAMTVGTATRRCRQLGLQLVATISTDWSEGKDKENSELLPERKPTPTDNSKKESEVHSLEQDVRSKQFAETKDLRNLVNKQCEDISKLLDITNGLNKRLEILETDVELYGSLGTTRRLAVLNMIAVLQNMLDHQICILVNNCKGRWVGKDKVFANEVNVSYYSAWWCWFNDIIHIEGMIAEDYWNMKIGFEGKKFFQDARVWNITKDASRGEKAHSSMLAAETALIRGMGGAMTHEMLRDAMGFYISILRPNRNPILHFFENLFSIEELNRVNLNKRKRKQQQATLFQLANKGFAINKDYVNMGMKLLEDILKNVCKLGADLDCIASTVEWVANYLLQQCKS